MQCPSCKEQIDDDSLFCDQCGEQIKVCVECGRPGKGKRCQFDGKELVPAGSQGAPAAAQVQQTPVQASVQAQTGGQGQIGAQVQTPVQPVQQTPVQQTPAQTGGQGQIGAQVQTPIQQTPVQTGVQAQTAAQVQQAPVQQAQMQTGGGNTVKFTGNGIAFEAKDGDVIGRKSGSFISIFASQSYVSGTHCKIVKLPAGWHIQDLGSTNGTVVQGNKLAPNAPYPLTNNTTVKIATTDFTVTFDDGGSTTRL
jgi:pSer/pThr/pTyr-binding forkhead associated (FHA) protein